MTRRGRSGGWRVWAEWWSPVLSLAAIWTAFRFGWGPLAAGFLFFGLLSVVGIALARDSERRVPWIVAVPLGATGSALLGPLRDAGLPTLLVLVALVVTSPPVRTRFRRRTEGVPLTLMSDHLLEEAWLESEAALARAAAHPEHAVAVVRRRAELLDEIIRRHEGAVHRRPGRHRPTLHGLPRVET